MSKCQVQLLTSKCLIEFDIFKIIVENNEKFNKNIKPAVKVGKKSFFDFF